jgi:hypothetical protein
MAERAATPSLVFDLTLSRIGLPASLSVATEEKRSPRTDFWSLMAAKLPVLPRSLGGRYWVGCSNS